MDKRVIEKKMESLRRSIQRVENKTPAEETDLENDIDLQDIFSVNLERAVQQYVDIGTHIIASSEEQAPDTMGETFQTLQNLGVLTERTSTIMKKAVGFRNIAVHNYEEINWAIVYSICTNQIDDFKQFAQEINAYISDL